MRILARVSKGEGAERETTVALLVRRADAEHRRGVITIAAPAAVRRFVLGLLSDGGRRNQNRVARFRATERIFVSGEIAMNALM